MWWSCLRFGALLAVLLASFPFAVGAAERQSQEPVEMFEDRVEVNEVMVDVVVTDRQGNAVLGLGIEDFTIEENGRLMGIVDLAYHTYGSTDLPLAPPPLLEITETWEATQPEPRYFIIFFHDLRRTDRQTLGVLGQQLRAGQGTRRWVSEELGPTDFVAVVRYDFRLWLFQDFTNDKEQLLEAINLAVARRRPGPLPEVPWDTVSLAAGLAEGDELRDATTSLRKALKVVARAAADIPGRKHLLFFSIGIGLPGSDRGIFNRTYVPSTAEVLNDAGVSVYSFDLTPPNAEHALAGIMNQVAELTGGTYYSHFYAFHKPLRTVTNELQGYYSLSYLSPYQKGTSGYRSFRVRTKDERLRVQSRRGYIVGESDPGAG